MVVGGMTQFLTKVQGMPQEIEKRLEQRVQKFPWGNKNKININKETIYAPITGGGRNLLDIPIRNKAIIVTWIHTYLDLSLSHPLWAYAADAIIKRHTPASEENIELEIRSNIFLQSWKTSMNKLPADLKELVKTAQEYGVCLDGLAICCKIQREMPIWRHIKSKATRCLFNSGNRVKCLKNHHRVRTVGDLEKLASHLEEDRHTQCGQCSCTACLYARNELSCASPHKCFPKAKQLLDSLPLKWNPSAPLPSKIIIPMEDEEEDEQGGRASFFQPRLITRGSLSDAFRIFIDSDECMEVYLHPELEETQPRNKVVVYTDGSAMNNGSDESTAGAGVFYQNGDARNKSIQLLNEVAQMNQASEIVGAKTAAEDNPKEVEMDLVSDSRHVLDGLDRCFITWENKGYFRIANSTITQVMVTRFRARSAATRLMWVKGHSGNLGEQRCR